MSARYSSYGVFGSPKSKRRGDALVWVVLAVMALALMLMAGLFLANRHWRHRRDEAAEAAKARINLTGPSQVRLPHIRFEAPATQPLEDLPTTRPFLLDEAPTTRPHVNSLDYLATRPAAP